MRELKDESNLLLEKIVDEWNRMKRLKPKDPLTLSLEEITKLKEMLSKSRRDHKEKTNKRTEIMTYLQSLDPFKNDKDHFF